MPLGFIALLCYMGLKLMMIGSLRHALALAAPDAASRRCLPGRRRLLCLGLRTWLEYRLARQGAVTLVRQAEPTRRGAQSCIDQIGARSLRATCRRCAQFDRAANVLLNLTASGSLHAPWLVIGVARDPDVLAGHVGDGEPDSRQRERRMQAAELRIQCAHEAMIANRGYR
jgi:hypothetical protein